MAKKTGKSLDQMANEINEPVDGVAKFNELAQANIRALAEAVYKDNEEEVERYTRKIIASLETYLKEGQTIDDLWDYLKNQGCSTTAIMAGLLRFFKGPKGVGEIPIENFIQLVLEAESDLHKALEIQKDVEKDASRDARLAFIEELRKSFPDLPSFPS